MLTGTLSLPLVSSGAPVHAPGRVIVRYKQGMRGAEQRRILTAAGVERVKTLVLVQGDVVSTGGKSVEEALTILRRDPGVVYAEPDWQVQAMRTPDDPRFIELYALRNTGQTGGTPGADIRAVPAWDRSTGSTTVLVGVIDSGVDYNHVDLAANVWVNPGEIPGNGLDDDRNGYKDDVHGFDFVNSFDVNGDGDFADPGDIVDADNAMDDGHHGTHVAGTIGAVGNNGIGVTGVCWRVTIVPIKFLDANGFGWTSDAILSLEYARRVGVHITNNSWGGPVFSQALLDAIEAAGAQGQLFVAAAGNWGEDNDVVPDYPSAYGSACIIAVAATDARDGLASFSNYGATSVDLGAPGVNILSCQLHGGYEVFSGTSMAAPHVTGVAALVKGRFPSYGHALLRDRILRSVDPVPALAGRCVSGGRLNALLAIADPDTLPPGNVGDLVTFGPGSTTMGLRWTSTGDDGNVGRATRYDFRYSTVPITPGNFLTATAVAAPEPEPSGTLQSLEVSGLAYGTTYYFALRALDEYDNAGSVSNMAVGTTLAAPHLAISTTTITSTLVAGTQETQILVLTNDGQGTLDFSIPQPEILLPPPLAASRPLQPPAARYSINKGNGDLRANLPQVDADGGPDAFGYRWADNQDAGGPTFAWIDIVAIGTRLDFSGEDQSHPGIPLGFEFPFYDGLFERVNVCTNGWLSFTDTDPSHTNQPLPTGGTTYPTNLVAPFWDALSLSGPTSGCYVHGDSTRFVVSWIDFGHHSPPGGGAYSFQVILYPSGEIRYQYLQMQPPTDSATIGIQNASRDLGLQVCFNRPYVIDGLAVRIMRLEQWLTVAPVSGRLGAGAQQSIQVHVDATTHFDGLNNGRIHIAHNAPNLNPVVVNVAVDVTGAPHITASDSLDFGTLFLETRQARNLTVTNVGSAPLQVGDITTNAPSLTAIPSSFTLLPGRARNVAVTWEPTAAGALAATLAIHSNDPANPVRNVAAVGAAIHGPELNLTQTSLAAWMQPGTTEVRLFRISNANPLPNPALTFTIATSLGKPHLGTAGSARARSGEPRERDGRILAGSGSNPRTAGAGGPDGFGYRWKDSDHPRGPVFSWIDITAIGTPVAFTGEDQNSGPIPLGFGFPFYGRTFTSLNVCTNGWISFTNSLATNHYNTPLPSGDPTDPEYLIAVFWDDLDFTNTGSAYSYNDGTRFILSWVNVPATDRFPSPGGGPYTFQLILEPSGKILLQYLDLQPPLDSATIGIMKGPFDYGLTVVWSAPYAHDGLAVEIQYIPEWLQVSPTSGTVHGGQGTNLTVTLNSAGLPPGTYDGTIHLTTNDPSESQVEVPVQLTVGTPSAATVALPREFDLKFAGVNPSRGIVRLVLALPEGRETALEVYDVRGAVVRRVLHRPLGPGLHAMAWDGRDERGRDVASGIYFLRMQAGCFAETARVTILR